jgi:CXCXC repeat
MAQSGHSLTPLIPKEPLSNGRLSIDLHGECTINGAVAKRVFDDDNCRCKPLI